MALPRAFRASLAMLALACAASGYQFVMEGATRRCFTEDIPIATKVIVHYTVLQGSGDAPVSLRALAHDGSAVYSRDHINSGKFAFDAPDALPGLTRAESESTQDDQRLDAKIAARDADNVGDRRLQYQFCFEQRLAGHHMPHLHAAKEPTRRIIFDVKYGTDAKTLEYYQTLAKEEHLSSTEQLFKAVEDQVSDVIRDIDEMRTRARRMESLNNKTSALVLWYSLSACLFVVAGATLSSFATQSFLAKRNLLKSALG